MRRRPNFLASIVGFLTAAVLLVGGVASAATSNAPLPSGGNGLKISPVRSDLTISPGKSQIVTIYVQNVTSQAATLRVIVNDFTASQDESGNPSIILNENQYAPSHSLKRFVPPIPDFSLAPGEQKAVPVTINVPANAAGGGYYGAVRFAPAATANNSNLTLAASVGSLILVRVPGNIKDNLKLVSLDVRKNGHPSLIFTSGRGLVMAARFQNNGNVQEQPFGKVILKKGTQVLETIEINNTKPRGNVLPGSIRRFEVGLNKVGSFGKYTVEGNFGYGNSGQLVSGQTTFYVVPLGVIIAVMLGLALVAFLIFGLPRLIRRYNQSVLRKAGRR